MPKGGKRKQATSDPLSHSYFNTPRPPHYLISKNKMFYLWGYQKQAFSLLSVFRICKNSKHCEMCDISQKCPPFRLALCLLGDTPKTPFRNLYLIVNPLSDIKPIFWCSKLYHFLRKWQTCEGFPPSTSLPKGALIRTLTPLVSTSAKTAEVRGLTSAVFFTSLSVLFLRFHQWQPFHFRVLQLLLEKTVLCVCENE